VFQLTKWYLDIVTEQGDALIAYAARVQIGGVPLSYASVLVSRAAAAADHEDAGIRGVEGPSFAGDACAWQNEALGISGRWQRSSPSIERILVTGPEGSVAWTCHMPSARAEARYRDLALTGTGYVECLELSIPPWKLPFRTLRWGRHLSDQHSLVWIEWDDGRTGRWIWLDGHEQPDARLTATGIVGLAGNRELRLRESRDLRNRAVLSSLTRTIPALQRHLEGSLAGMHEHKQVSRSALVAAGHAIDDGWALHEVVTW
jgi:hypothetical protein